MTRMWHSPEQIIHLLRQAEVGLAGSKTVATVCRELEISEQTYNRWRRENGGMQTSQARRLRELEKGNARLKQAVANLTLDNLILKEASKGNF
jgi:putative transposase